MTFIKQLQASHTGRIFTLFLLIFIDTIAYFLVIPVLVKLIVHNQTGIFTAAISLHEREFLYGLAMMLSPLAFLIASPVVGFLSDKLGRKSILTFCLICAFAGFMLPIAGIYSRALWLILLGRFIAGGSTSSQPVVQAAITDFTNGNQKAFYLSLIAFAMTAAMVLGPLFGSFLSDGALSHWFNLTTPYWLGTALAGLNLVLLLFFYKDTNTVKVQHPKQNLQFDLNIFWQALKHNRVWLYLTIFLLFEIAWSLYYQVIFLYFSQVLNFSSDKIGLFTGYSGIWMSLGLTIIYKFWLKHHSVEKILWLSLGISSVFFVANMILPMPPYIWIWVIPMSICIGTAYPSLIALLSNLSYEDNQGMVLGFASTIMALAWMLTGFASGALYALDDTVPFVITVISILFGTILLSLQLFKFKNRKLTV